MANSHNFMSYKDFETLLNGEFGSYYVGRWMYYEAVLNIIKDISFQSVVELGPGRIPIVKSGDVILNPLDDSFGKPNEIYQKSYVFDATTSPWPIDDKAYDLFIALQVWEHLDNKQTRAFKELMRVSKRAILSFPYMWDGGKEKPSHRAHRDIDLALINDWTLNIEPTIKKEIPRTGDEFAQGPRMIYYWDFTK